MGHSQKFHLGHIFAFIHQNNCQAPQDNGSNDILAYGLPNEVLVEGARHGTTYKVKHTDQSDFLGELFF